MPWDGLAVALSHFRRMSYAHPSAPLSGPDAPTPLENFLEHHSRKLVLGLAVALGLVALFTSLHLKRQKHEAKAGSALVAASDIEAVRKVIADFADTPAAVTAQLLLADKQLDAGDANGAVETLRAFLSRNPQHPLASQARLALATALNRLGKTDDAGAELAAFLKESPSSTLAPLAITMQAELAEQKGDLDGARNLYEQAKTSFPDSNFSKLAGMRAQRVGFVAPTEIDPPPPPPPPPTSPGTPAPTGTPSLLESNAPIPIPGSTPPAAPEIAPLPEAAPPPAAPQP